MRRQRATLAARRCQTSDMVNLGVRREDRCTDLIAIVRLLQSPAQNAIRSSCTAVVQRSAGLHIFSTSKEAPFSRRATTVAKVAESLRYVRL